MRDDSELLTARTTRRESAALSGATILAFPQRAVHRPPFNAATPPPHAPVEFSARLIATVSGATDGRGPFHAATQLAALGAIAGFSAQQSLLLAGGSNWTQPLRAEHLDRLLLADAGPDPSLWGQLRATAQGLGARHLPEPQKLLSSTLRCVGTAQFGVITLPLEYRLNEQPQTSLVRHWARVRQDLVHSKSPLTAWPHLTAEACARAVALNHRLVPPHVALRVVMQAALAMALLEPRLVPGAAVKAG